MTTTTGRDALPHCDLVMKGGITSGIVYPPAVQALSKKYRFRQIGGTSAGAIAAGCTAAAEYGSASDLPDAGFDGLGKISDWLGRDNNLLSLFDAEPQTRPLLKTLLALMPQPQPSSTKRLAVLAAIEKVAGITRALFQYSTVGFVAGVIVGILLRRLTLVGTGNAISTVYGWQLAWSIFWTLLFGLVGGWIGALVSLARILIVRVPKNFYGICTGHVDPAQQRPVLTDWLHDRLQALAALKQDDPPLTFGMLSQRDIKLLTVSSNISEGQPYAIPFDRHRWLFNAEEMGKFFPKPVVDHLIAKSYKSKRVSAEAPFYFLPEEADLPVLLAMRMSLSFPILICALPLYSVKWKGIRRQAGKPINVSASDLDRNWFSDGGISSNFPIHFFDAWLPKCPTFGINLRSMPPGEAKDYASALRDSQQGEPAPAADAPLAVKPLNKPSVAVADEGRVFLPSANAPAHPEWNSLDKLTDFLGAIWNTAQNFRDTTQSMLPSYRERIVNVRFSDDEGGLNLTMGEKKVKAIQDRGAAAGKLLVEEFDFRAHQWVRLLVLMPQVETQIKKLKALLQSPEYTDLLTSPPAPEAAAVAALPYGRQDNWRADADRRLKALVKLIDDWEALDKEWLATHPDQADEVFFPFDCPKPTAVLRVTPRV